MKKQRRETVTISVRIRPEMASALDNWAHRRELYIYEALEKLIEAGLEEHGTSVEQEAKVSA